MAEENQSNPKINNQQTHTLKSQNLRYLLDDIDTILAISVLKYFSSPENPLSVRQISDAVYSFRRMENEIDIEVDIEKKERDSKNKKIGHKLSDLTALMQKRCEIAEQYNWNENTCYGILSEEEDFYCSLADLLYLVFGGLVRCTKKGVRRYYFQPMISPSHIDLIKSCLMANQYFTEQESSYLIRAVESLGAAKAPSSCSISSNAPTDCCAKDNSAPLLQEYIQDRNVFLPGNAESLSIRSYPLLNTISCLYTAITEGIQIEMTIGAYQNDARSGKPILKESHSEKAPYHLNPYAIFFSDGHHYLIATKSSDTAMEDEIGKVLHFRVDRIVTITSTNRPREQRPKSLQDYWKNKETGFDQQLYSQMHPTMAYSEKCAAQKAILQTKHPIALSIVADAFGRDNVRIKKEITAPDPQNQTSSPKLKYELEIYAQRDNIIRFCSQQHALVKLILPAAMVEDVRKTLSQSLADYNTPE